MAAGKGNEKIPASVAVAMARHGQFNAAPEQAVADLVAEKACLEEEKQTLLKKTHYNAQQPAVKTQEELKARILKFEEQQKQAIDDGEAFSPQKLAYLDVCKATSASLCDLDKEIQRIEKKIRHKQGMPEMQEDMQAEDAKVDGGQIGSNVEGLAVNLNTKIVANRATVRGERQISENYRRDDNPSALPIPQRIPVSEGIAIRYLEAAMTAEMAPSATNMVVGDVSANRAEVQAGHDVHIGHKIKVINNFNIDSSPKEHVEHVLRATQNVKRGDDFAAEIKDEEIDRLSASLKADYCQCSHIQRLFSHDQLPISESYVNLKLSQDVGMGDDFVDFKTLYESKPAPHSRQRTLIVGNAGMGKTTLLKRMVYEWAEPSKGLWAGYFSQVFWIPLRELRNLSEGNCTPAGLLHFIYFKDEPQSTLQSLQCVLKQQSATSLWLLDGYDEVLTGLAPAADKLLKEFLAQKHVLITSRGHAVTFLRKQFKAIDRLGGCPEKDYELVGFKRWEVREYVEKFFSRTPEKIKEMLSFITQPHLRDISKTPLHLEILCSLVNEKGIAYLKAKNLSSSTALYQEMLIWMMQHCAEKTPEIYEEPFLLPEEAPQIQLEKKFTKHISILEELAFNAKTELSITHQSVFGMLESHHSKNTQEQRAMLAELLALNILRQTGKQPNSSNSYEFVHLSFQEFLAAKYFSNQLIQADVAAAKQLLATHLPTYKHQEKFLWFLSGLLKGDPDKLQVFLEALMAENGITEERNFRLFDQFQSCFLLIHCLEEIVEPNGFGALPLVDNLLHKIAVFAEQALSTQPAIFDSKTAQKLLAIRHEVLRHLKSCPRVTAASKVCELLEERKENKHTLEEHQAVISLALESLRLIEDLSSLLKKIIPTQSVIQLYEVFDQLKEATLSEDDQHQLCERLEIILFAEQTSKEILHVVFNFMDELKLWKEGQQERLMTHWSTQQSEISLHGLIKGLSLPDPQLKIICANALARFGDRREAMSALAACLVSDDAVLAKIAIESLEKFALQGNADAAVSLMRHVKTATEADLIRWMDALVKSNPATHTRIGCIEVLRTISTSSVALEEAILSAFKKWIQEDPATALPPLIQGLKSPNTQIRLRCILSLNAADRLGNRIDSKTTVRTVERLKNCLDDANPTIKNEAAFVLRKWSGEISQFILPIAEKMLTSEDNAIRLQGVSILGKNDQRSQEAIRLLANYLDDPDATLREKVTLVLKRWASSGNSHALQVAKKMLGSRDAAIRLQWVLALGSDPHGNQEAVSLLADYLEDRDSRLREETESILKKWTANGSLFTLPVVKKRLASNDAATRLAWVLALQSNNNRSPEAVSLLENCLEDKDPQIKQEVTSTLRKWASAGNRSVLVVAQKILSSADAAVRLEGILVVGSDGRGSDESVDLLLPCLKDSDLQIRQETTKILKKWAGKGNKPALALAQKMLGSENTAIRLEWILAVGSDDRGSDVAVNLLLPYLEDPDPQIRQEIATILKKWAVSGNRHALAVAKKILDSVDVAVRLEWVLVMTSSSSGNDVAVDMLLVFLEDSDLQTRQKTASALKKWARNGNQSALAAVPKMLRSADDAVRLEGVLAIGSSYSGSDKSVDLLLPYLEDPDAQVRQQIVAILGKWANRGNRSALANTREILARYPAIRLEWILTVGSRYRGSDEFVDLLLPYLEDPDAQVSQETASILKNRLGNGNRSALALAQKMLGSVDAAVRLEWVLAVGSSYSGSDESAGLLLPCLEDSDLKIKQETATILKKWASKGNKFALDVAKKMLGSADPAVRLEWVLAVGSDDRGSDKSANLLLPCLEDSDLQIRQKTTTILGKWVNSGSQSVLTLAKKMLSSADTTIRLKWVLAVGSNYSGSDQSAGLLLPCLEDSDLQIRQKTTTILGKWASNGNKPALNLAKKMVSSADAAVRLEWVLGVGSSYSGSNDSAGLLLPCLEDPDAKVRQETVTILKKWAGKDNKSALTLAQKMLRSRDAAIRLEWVLALGSHDWGSDKSEDLLLPCLEDPDPKIRQETTAILKKWARNANQSALAALEENRVDSKHAAARPQADWAQAPDDRVSAAALRSSQTAFLNVGRRAERRPTNKPEQNEDLEEKSSYTP